MAIWKLLLISLLGAVALGCIAGVLIGKYRVKISRPDYKPLLSNKERIIYFSCVLLGAACIGVGVHLSQPKENAGDDMMGMDGMMPGMEMQDDMPGGDGEMADDFAAMDDGAQADGEDGAEGAADPGEDGADGEEAGDAEDASPTDDATVDEPAAGAAIEVPAAGSSGGGVVVHRSDGVEVAEFRVG